jgi:hypothetical protein
MCLQSSWLALYLKKKCMLSPIYGTDTGLPKCIKIPQPSPKHSQVPNEAHFLTATLGTATRQQRVIQTEQNHKKQHYSHNSSGGHEDNGVGWQKYNIWLWFKIGTPMIWCLMFNAKHRHFNLWSRADMLTHTHRPYTKPEISSTLLDFSLVTYPFDWLIE